MISVPGFAAGRRSCPDRQHVLAGRQHRHDGIGLAHRLGAGAGDPHALGPGSLAGSGDEIEADHAVPRP